jgi:hypothetical protein
MFKRVLFAHPTTKYLPYSIAQQLAKMSTFTLPNNDAVVVSLPSILTRDQVLAFPAFKVISTSTSLNPYQRPLLPSLFPKYLVLDIY